MDKATLDRLISHCQIYHSDLQMEEFIVRSNGITAYGCLKQASRELARRWQALKHLFIGRQRLEIDIDELETGLRDNVWPGAFSRRRKKLDLMEKRAALEECNRNVADTEREFWKFCSITSALESELGITGELTPDRRAALDRDMWKERTINAALTDALGNRRLGQETVETLALFPVEWREEAAGVLVDAGLYMKEDVPGLLKLLDFMGKRQHPVSALGDNGKVPRLGTDGRDCEIRALLGETI